MLSAERKLRWRDVYREVELYKSALRVYTKPLFGWRKALFTSTDGRTLYDLATRGLSTLEGIHASLRRESFEFRPSVALHYNFNGKHRTLYIAPWEERIVDLLLYRILTSNLQEWFSPNSYAYREQSYGLDRCQTRIARLLRDRNGPLFAAKRDISKYFDSVDHEILLAQLRDLVEPKDYLFRLLEQRVRFLYCEDAEECRARIGIPFGTAIACALANVYLTPLDRSIEHLPGVRYFRYADDVIAFAPEEALATELRERMNSVLASLKLKTKASHEIDFVIGSGSSQAFPSVQRFRHLGLQFSGNGDVSLSRDKSRKIQNLFRYAFRRAQKRWKREGDPVKRAAMLIQIAGATLERGVRNVAIVDYYLKHVTDEERLKAIDRWLAEEVLANVFGGHKKKHFQRLSFAKLRSMGLPSVVHRRRLILRGKIDSPFFVWEQQKAQRAFRGAVARP